MNAINEAINAMTAENWTSLIASGATIIISVWGIFAVLRHAKNLLNMLDDPSAEHPADFIDADGQIWENGVATGEYAAFEDHDAHVEAYRDDLWEGIESLDDENDDGGKAYREERDEAIAMEAHPGDDVELDNDPEEAADQIRQALDDGDQEEAAQIASDYGWDLEDFR